MLANMGFVNTILGGGRSNPHSWGGVGLCGPDRPTLVSESCRLGRGTGEGQAGSGKWAEPVAVAHSGPEGAQGRAGRDPAYSGQLPGTSWNLEKGAASFRECQALGLVGEECTEGVWVTEVACSCGPCGRRLQPHPDLAVLCLDPAGPSLQPQLSLQPQASFLCGEHCPPRQPAFQSSLAWDQFQPTGQSGKQGRRPG